jgi:2,3-bisphosphoglycerate-dependent phosphoglycerate mutase
VQCLRKEMNSASLLNDRNGGILIIRHAQSSANAGGRTSDPASIKITEMGLAQAEYVASLFSHPPGLIVLSSYLRTRQTAEPLMRRFPAVPVEEWPVQEFTYLDPAICRGTTYTERKGLAEAYWAALDPKRRNGARCESFACFIERVADLRIRLQRQISGQGAVVFTHGYVMKALIWLEEFPVTEIGRREMAAFDCFRRRLPTPNCCVIHGQILGTELRLTTTPANYIADHLKTE